MMMQSIGSKSGSVVLQVSRTSTRVKRMSWSPHLHFMTATTGRMFPLEHPQQQQQHGQSFHCCSNINRDFTRPLRVVVQSRSNVSTLLHSESKSNSAVPKVVPKGEELDNYEDDNDDDDDTDNKKQSANTSDEGATEWSMKVLKERYNDSLKRMLADKHGITIDKKKQNWMSPWRIAVMIHCLDTKQDYSIITKRPAPTPKQVEQYVLHQGIQNTKENKLRARMEMKRNQKHMAKQLLVKVMEERGHVMRRPPTDKSDWQELYIQIQESVLKAVHNHQDGPDEASPSASDSTRA